MPQERGHTRRKLLKLTGSAAAVGLAGCTSLGAETGDDSEEEGGDQHNGSESGDHDEEGNGEHQDGEEGGDNHDGEESGEHHDGEEGGDNHDGEEGGDNHDGEESGEHHDEEESGDEHGHNHDEGTLEEPSASAEVTLQTTGGQHHFGPHAVWIEPGGTVTWTLESGSHDVVAYHPDNDRPLRMPEDADPWSSDLLTEQGETFEQTFETEGVYDYYCTPHEAVGMVGTVIVGHPDPHGQPALEEPQDSLPDGASSELADLGETANEALGHDH